MNPPATTTRPPVLTPATLEQAANELLRLEQLLTAQAADTSATAARRTVDAEAGEPAHLERIRAALGNLQEAVSIALAVHVPVTSVDRALRPTLIGLRSALHAPDRAAQPVDLDWFEPHLSGGYPDNLDRAAWAAAAVRAFGLRTRQIVSGKDMRGDAEEDIDGVEEMAADLICDLMHLLDAIGGDAEYTVQRGQGYHLDEVEEEACDEGFEKIADAG